MSGAVAPPFCDAWIWNVVQRKAPGAMSAMAFTVIPVRVRLRFISPDAAVVSATRSVPFVRAMVLRNASHRAATLRPGEPPREYEGLVSQPAPARKRRVKSEPERGTGGAGVQGLGSGGGHRAQGQGADRGGQARARVLPDPGGRGLGEAGRREDRQAGAGPVLR